MNARLVTALLLATSIFPFSALALVMRDDGPEPVIIQIKEALRASNDLDGALSELASFQKRTGVSVAKRWAGPKYLELIRFPKGFTEAEALEVIARLQKLPSIEKVVAVSAFNLEFRAGDFVREYTADQTIPDEARRGFDVDRLTRGTATDLDRAIEAPHVPNRIIVRWKDEFVWKAEQTGFRQLMAGAHSQKGCRVIDEQNAKPTQLIQTLEFDSSRSSVAEKMKEYAAMESVDYVQPDYIYYGTATPNDFAYPSQYSLPIISAPAAWDITTGAQHFVVAVADTGANVTHPDFSPNLATGHRNFVANPDNSNVADNHGHGSNVASIVGAKGNNGGQYMTGVAWNTSLLFLKVLNAQNTGTTTDVAAGINYAYGPGRQAIAINLSLATPPSSSIDTTLRTAIRNARANDMVVVSAAGNNNVNSDLSNQLVSPASIPVDNVIPVGATNRSDARETNFPQGGGSNFGRYRVELGAPGVEILGLRQNFFGSSDPNSYSFFSGTSQAAPHVTGVLELVKSVYPWENYRGIIDRVLMATDDIPGLGTEFRTGGRLNAAKALQKRNLIRNLSTRARVENGDRILIGGFILGGTGGGTLKVGIRGIGPSFPPLGVARLNDPKITLNNSAGQTVFANDDWNNLPQDQKNDLIAGGIVPADPREAAMVVTLAPGGYTVFLESQDGQFGVGSFEVYEYSGNTNEETRLQNVSTRCLVGTGDEVVIAGCILGDPSQTNKRRLAMFGKGPSLAGVLPGTLPNPILQLFNSGGTLLETNDQWRNLDGTSTGLEDKLTEANFAPGNENESLLWPALPQGGYTAILSDAGAGNGIGLIEFYEF